MLSKYVYKLVLACLLVLISSITFDDAFSQSWQEQFIQEKKSNKQEFLAGRLREFNLTIKGLELRRWRMQHQKSKRAFCPT